MHLHINLTYLTKISIIKYIMSETHYLNFDKLNQEIKRKGFGSIGSFLKEAGLHRNTLRRYSDNKNSIFTPAIEKIANFLKIDPLTISASGKNKNNSSSEKEKILEILGELSKENKLAFCLFGSRARGSARQYSDWDIAVTNGEENLKSETYLNLKELLNQATDDLPVKVDLVNIDEAPEWFLSEINYAPVFLCGNRESYNFFIGVLHGIRKSKQN